MVRTNIPELAVPELPEDPAEYLPYLQALNLFEIASLSEEDAQRTLHYQEDIKRTTTREKFKNENDFLKSLNMQSVAQGFNEYAIPRVAQLTQRSNQFNFRTIRYSEEDIRNIAASSRYCTRYFTLQDAFGDYGIISVVILEKQKDALFIDTWIMSCRVLKRGMENFVLNELIEVCKQEGCSQIIGEYLPTKKNILVMGLFEQLGFSNSNDHWVLDISKYIAPQIFIQKSN